MTRIEATQFLALVKLAYPSSYQNLDDVSRKATIKMWERAFSTVPMPVMEMALQRYQKTNKFPPTVAEINESLTSVYSSAVDQMQIAEQIGNEPMRRAALAIVQATSDYRMGRPEGPLLSPEQVQRINADPRLIARTAYHPTAALPGTRQLDDDEAAAIRAMMQE